MSLGIFLNVWNHSEAPGLHRLVLCAMADQCDPKGAVHASIRGIGERCGISRGQMVKIIDRLQAEEEIRLVSKGGGKSTPNRYQIAPRYIGEPVILHTEAMCEPAEEWTREQEHDHAGQAQVALSQAIATPAPVRLTPVPVQPVPSFDISDLIEAAGVQINPAQPFYWMRMEHTIHLAEEMQRRNIKDPAHLIDLIKKARNRGAAAPSGARSVKAVLSILERHPNGDT